MQHDSANGTSSPLSSGAPHSGPLLLGLDTGGTYTDAVLYCDDDGIVATAKALTTRHDLSIGVSQAIAAALDAQTKKGAGVEARIALVSLSTTLATNALVEGQGGRAGLVMIGFDAGDLARDGLADALGDDPVLFLKGGHDVYGREAEFDIGPLDAWLGTHAPTISAVAVVGYFAVRNPAHELAVAARVKALTGLPVTQSHELTSKLGGPRRALTTVLNARLVPMISRLIRATLDSLSARGIAAPLMVVRGDGALISADEALNRPIETILSGPAASIVGARHLTGLDRAVVSDIGGTTTDVAVLDDGVPRLDADGAIVGPYRTMVEAVAMHTFGLGGDSEIHVAEDGMARGLRLGPRRLMPLSLAATLAETAVLSALKRQLSAPTPGRLDGRFAHRAGLPAEVAASLSGKERALYDRLTDAPQPLDEVLASVAQRATLDRLAARGLVLIAGFTPSDAMHVLARQDQWHGEAARLGAELFGRRRDGRGDQIATGAAEIAEAVARQMTRQSSEVILKALFAEDGLPEPGPAASQVIDRALTRAKGFVEFALKLDRPLVALGASAPVHYPAVADMLGAASVIPAHAGVANALGAVVGRVRETAIVFVTEPEPGLYWVNGASEHRRLDSREEAFALARELADGHALMLAGRSGADHITLSRDAAIDMPLVDGQEKLVEARFMATASGRPRIAIR